MEPKTNANGETILEDESQLYDWGIENRLDQYYQDPNHRASSSTQDAYPYVPNNPSATFPLPPPAHSNPAAAAAAGKREHPPPQPGEFYPPQNMTTTVVKQEPNSIYQHSVPPPEGYYVPLVDGMPHPAAAAAGPMGGLVGDGLVVSAAAAASGAPVRGARRNSSGLPRVDMDANEVMKVRPRSTSCLIFSRNLSFLFAESTPEPNALKSRARAELELLDLLTPG